MFLAWYGVDQHVVHELARDQLHASVAERRGGALGAEHKAATSSANISSSESPPGSPCKIS